MKVLQINAVYGHGSTGTIVRDIVSTCEKSGIECYVASPDVNVCNAKNYYVIGNSKDHKLHALYTRLTGKQGYASSKATKRLLEYIDSVNPNIVHIHNLHSNFINLRLLFSYLALKDIPTIITLHDCWFYTGGCFHYTAAGCRKWQDKCGNCPKRGQDNFSIFFDPSAKVLSDRAKYLKAIPRLYIVGVSSWIAGEASKGFLKNSNISYIRNGVDLDVFKPTESSLRLKLNLEDKYVILGPASKWLDPINKKALIWFAENMRKDEILMLYGANQNIESLPANIILYGYTKDRTELASLYTCADVFANTTHEDSLSLINVEAQACGTPVVTYDQTGPKETVDGIVSRSVPVGNEEALLSAIHDIRDRKLPNQANLCREFVKEYFDMQSRYKEFVKLYQSIL